MFTGRKEENVPAEAPEVRYTKKGFISEADFLSRRRADNSAQERGIKGKTGEISSQINAGGSGKNDRPKAAGLFKMTMLNNPFEKPAPHRV